MSKKAVLSGKPTMHTGSFVGATSGRRKWKDNVRQPGGDVTVTFFDPTTRVKHDANATDRLRVMRGDLEFKRSYR